MKTILLAAFAAIASCAGAQQSPVLGHYDTGFYENGCPSYAIPYNIATPTVGFTTLPDGRTEISLQFAGGITIGQDMLEIEALYDATPGSGMWDRAVVAALGGYTYQSSPSIGPNAAGVVDDTTETRIGTAEVQITTDTVYIRFNPTLVGGGACQAVRLRWFPASLPFASLAHDLNSVPVLNVYNLTFPIGDDFARPHVPEPDAPVPVEPEVIDISKLLCLSALETDTDEVGTPIETDPPTTTPIEIITPALPPSDVPPATAPKPTANGPIPMPTSKGWVKDWGPGDRNTPKKRWQPMPQPPPAGVVKVDIDGDGVKDDYRLPGSDRVPYTDLIISYYVVDDASLVAVIGRDTNGDGFISKNEVLGIIAECCYSNAVHDCIVSVVDGKVKLIWTVDENGSDGKTPTGARTTFFYDCETGYLKVMKVDQNGNLLVWNPTTQTWVVAPPDAIWSWEGPSKNYPGWDGAKQLC